MSMRIRRGAFTLVELLVAMSIIVVLASLTLMVVVNMGERDGTTDAAGLTRQWLMIAKNRAARDHAPRGLRLLPGSVNGSWVTELQYIEQPPPYQPNPNSTNGPSDAHLVFFIQIDPMTFSRTGIQCQMRNLTIGDAGFIVSSLNSWLSISGLSNSSPAFGTRVLSATGPLAQVLPLDPAKFTVNLTLDRNPDDTLGAAGTSGLVEVCRSYSFAITMPPQPIMGEPPLQLPKNLCIDLTPATFPPTPSAPPFLAAPSVPDATAPAGGPYDIVFSPSGQVLSIGAARMGRPIIHLWHRDYTKLTNAPNGNNALVILNNPFVAPFPAPIYDMYPFQNGGVQQIVTIRCKTGSLGQFPVMWPDAGGAYSSGDPFFFATQGTTNP